MLERLTPDATKAIVLAQEAAQRLGHNYIDTEILLLGLIADGCGLAARALESVGVSPKAARMALEAVVGRGSDFVSRDPAFTAAAQQVLKTASTKGRGLPVTTEHILRALLRQVDCDAIRVLQSLSIDPEVLAGRLKQLNGDAPVAEPEMPLSEDECRPCSRQEALSDVFGLNSFIEASRVPAGMLTWFDEKDKVLGVYINAEDDYLVLGERSICWYDGEAKTYVEYQTIHLVEEPKDIEDPYLRLILRPKGKVVMLPVLHCTEDFPDYVAIRDYLSFCTEERGVKMNIQEIQSKEDLVYFLRQPNVKSEGFEDLANWLQRGEPKPSWLGPLNIAPEVLADPSVWRLIALMLLRAPEAADKS